MVSDVKRSEDIPPVKADPEPMNPKPETLNLNPKPLTLNPGSGVGTERKCPHQVQKRIVPWRCYLGRPCLMALIRGLGLGFWV